MKSKTYLAKIGERLWYVCRECDSLVKPQTKMHELNHSKVYHNRDECLTLQLIKLDNQIK